ncbi:MAG: TOBE domain-containing protein [Cloacibacillus sp.]
MQLSARNQLKATVTEVKKGAVNNEIDMRLEKGTLLTSIITTASSDSLGLEAGKEVYAVIKASNVMIGEEPGGLRLSARNQLKGTVAAVNHGAVNAEVLITLESGEEIASIITMASAERLALAAGVKAAAIIKASDVMIGVKE